MPALILRPYEDTDREAAVELFLELNRHEFTITGDRRTDRGGAELCVEELEAACSQGAVAIVAEWGGVPAGLLVWALRTDEPFVEETARRYGRVEDIVVAAAHRGKGVGKALLAEAERLTREAGLTRLKLTVLAGNEIAIRAYLGAGYRTYAQVMEKPLD